MIKPFNFTLILFFIFSNLFALNDFSESSYINTKNVSYNEKLKLIQLGNNSFINTNNINIMTDEGLIDYQNDSFFINGKFYLNENLNILTGSNLRGNTKLTNFSADNISYIYNNDLKIDSNSIKREDDILIFFNNFITPCEINGYFNCPTWSLKIKKTKYQLSEDKFTHYDSFLQIADKKILYLPYFSHYGTKAQRKSGFLTPSLEFDLLNNTNRLITPYYIPINQSSDLVITPKIEINQNIKNINQNFSINNVYEKISQNGIVNLELFILKNPYETTPLSTLKFKSDQTLNKNTNIEINGIYTNNVSSVRSINANLLPFQDSVLRLNKYNTIVNDDLIISEINTSTPFDDSDADLIPLQIPHIRYINDIQLKNNIFLNNNLNFYILRRNESNNLNPKENIGITFENNFINNFKFRSNNFLNKLKIHTSTNYVKYDHNSNLNDNFIKGNIFYSTELNKLLNKEIKAKFKFILSENIISNKIINKEPGAITFNYKNLFNENRFFDYDLNDNSKRIVYGFEYKTSLINNLNVKIGQAYELNTNNHYLNKINQNDQFSDYAIEAIYSFNNLMLNLDSRISNNDLSKKEVNYTINFNDQPLNLRIGYNETSANAFKENSDETQSLNLFFKRNLNDNIILSYETLLNLKNNYAPYRNELTISVFDECSKFDISYSNSKFNDNNITKPEEKINLTYSMDYLGFFQYEQNTNLIYDKKQ